jgi:hypothetical protein
MDQGPRHGDEIDTTSSIVGAPEPQWYDVEEVHWHLHAKKNTPGKPPTLCVSYYVSDDTMPAGNLGWIVVREWVCFEHEGFALQKAFAWWDARSVFPFPASVAHSIMGQRGSRQGCWSKGKASGIGLCRLSLLKRNRR